jgi:glutaminyl-peptide cyclotransferase
MKRPLKHSLRALRVLLVIPLVACLEVQPSTPAFNGQRALEDIRQLVAIGPRVAGTPGAQAARDYIKKQLQSAGLTVVEQPFEADTPLGRVRMVNLLATISGGPAPSQPAPRLVIGGHYDTKRFKDFTFVGANDGGSSAAFLIELGRVLHARSNRLPIELLFLDGEEAVVEWQGTDHTYGSRYYVEAARKDGTLKSIKAFILVDMIGDKDLLIKRETNSTPSLMDAVLEAARRLGRREFSSEPYPVEDDHLEFLAAGVPSVDIIDLEYYTSSGKTAWHSQFDTMDNVSASSLQAVGDVLIAALPAIESDGPVSGR